MTPTNELRFVLRDVQLPHLGEGISHTIQVLQQKWIDGSYPEYQEWRDVPIEKETK